MTCYKVSNMAIEAWIQCAGDEQIDAMEDDERWTYIANFMVFAQRGDKECRVLLEKVAEGLKEILGEEGARSGLDRAEEMAGVKCEEM
jgi:hypothetical protein